MLSNGQKSGAVDIQKIPAAENCADMLTKPLVGATFDRHRVTILGLAMASPKTLLKLHPSLLARIIPYVPARNVAIMETKIPDLREIIAPYL